MSDFGDLKPKCNCYLVSEFELAIIANSTDELSSSKLAGAWMGGGSIKHKKTVMCSKKKLKTINTPSGWPNPTRGKCSFKMDPPVTDGDTTKGAGDSIKIYSQCIMDCKTCYDSFGCMEKDKELCKVEISTSELKADTPALGGGNNGSSRILKEMWSIWQVHENPLLTDPGDTQIQSIEYSVTRIKDLLRSGVGKPKKYCGFSYEPDEEGGETEHPGIGKPRECKRSKAEPITGQGSEVEQFCRNKKTPVHGQ